MKGIWDRFLYLWAALGGWILFTVCALLRHPLAFWIGCVFGIVLAVTAIVLSIRRLTQEVRDVLLHGIAWLLAVSLAFLAFTWIYAVLHGI